MNGGAFGAWTWPPPTGDTYRPDEDEPYWFRDRETADPDVRDAAILDRIRAVMGYAYERAPFYRRKWDEAGIHPEDVTGLEEFEQVPPVTKAELREDQAEHPPFGSYLCIDPTEIHHLHGTSGTTGRPTAFAIGRDDWRAIAQAHARCMWAMGIRPSDTVFIGAFFSLYMGSWGALVGAERLGATAFPFGAGAPGQTRRAVHWLRETRPSVFYGTPSYALYLAETAEEEGVDPRDLGLERMFFSGEPGASIPTIRRRIEDIYGAEVYDSGSMAELGMWMNLAESSGRTGMLVWQDVVYTEVVDPVTYRRVPYGSEGTPLYTTLERTSQPMIRLLSNDLTRWEAPDSPCGRTYPVLPRGIYGRIDDMFTVRGENIYPSAIDDVVNGVPNYGGEHRIVISRDETMDELVVQVEVDEKLAAQDGNAIAAWRDGVATALGTVLGVRARVVDVPQDTFERSQMKSNRVIDNRDLLRSVLSESS